MSLVNHFYGPGGMTGLVAVAALFLLPGVVSAQNPPQFSVTPATGAPEFFSYIDGSKNPELIDDNTIYAAVARSLAERNPARCGPQGNSSGARGFPVSPPCIAGLDGVDMDKAVQLANEYLQKKRSSSEGPTAEVCGARLAEFSGMDVAEFGAFLDEMQKSSNDEEAAFFRRRARELLDDDDYDNLMAYAESYRTRTVKSVVDQRKMMEMSGMTPAFLVQQWCSRIPGQP